MGILDGMKAQWNKMQGNIDEQVKKQDQQRKEQDAKDMKSLKYEKVPIQNEKTTSSAGQSPAERVAPGMVEKAKQAEQQRQQPPASRAAVPPKEVVPSKLIHDPVLKTTPTITQPNVTYVSTPTGSKAVVSQQPAPIAQQQPKQTQEYNSKLKESSPLPHERMAAKLDKAPVGEANKVANARVETGKKLEFFSDVHKPKQGIKP